MEDAVLSFLAYADRVGVITITDTATAKPAPPKGTFPIAMHHDRSILVQAVSAIACHAPDNETLLVPGSSSAKGVARHAVHEMIRQVENLLLCSAGRTKGEADVTNLGGTLAV